MARAATTFDVFNAIAEGQRRSILDLLAHGERAVNDLAFALGWVQPRVSKHLKVLREVGLVDVRQDGQRRLYRIDAEQLKPIHAWIQTYENLWSHQADQIKLKAEARAALAASKTPAAPTPRKES